MVGKSNSLEWGISIGVANITLDKITIFTSRKTKTGMYNWPDRPTATAPMILATKKMKTAKNIFNRKSYYRYTYSCCFRVIIYISREAKTGICNWPDTFAIAAFALRFLLVEKQKLI